MICSALILYLPVIAQTNEGRASWSSVINFSYAVPEQKFIISIDCKICTNLKLVKTLSQLFELGAWLFTVTSTDQKVSENLKSRSSTFSVGMINANNLVSGIEKINSLKSRHSQLDPLASTVSTHLVLSPSSNWDYQYSLDGSISLRKVVKTDQELCKFLFLSSYLQEHPVGWRSLHPLQTLEANLK